VQGEVDPSGVLDIVMRLCFPKVTCLLFLGGNWVGLYHFRSMGSDSYYLDREHASAHCPREEWSSWSVETVEECWNNCLRLLNRAFLVSLAFRKMWEMIWTNLRRLKVHKSRYFPALSSGEVVYEILDTMGSNLFLMISRHDLTAEQLEGAMARCCVNESHDGTFMKIYNQLEKEYERKSQQRLLVIDSNSDDTENPRKKIRLEKDKAKKDKKKEKDKKSDGRDTISKKGEGPCFKFLSQEGCTRSNCHFIHAAVSDASADRKSKLREMMTARGIVIDESKF
jgi:hypothetical protein